MNLQFFFSLASSFYPGYHGHTSIFDPEPGAPPQANNSDSEDGWTDEEDVTDLTQQQPGKIKESLAKEVCH